MPLVKNENRALDRSESYTINMLNLLLAVDTEDGIIGFKVKTLTFAFINSFAVLLQ
jgi:hypothetical protein